jgi:hypothetical protein
MGEGIAVFSFRVYIFLGIFFPDRLNSTSRWGLLYQFQFKFAFRSMFTPSRNILFFEKRRIALNWNLY